MFLLFILTFLFTQFYSTDACSCDLASFHDVYCRADWVARMKVDNKRVVPDQFNRSAYLVYSVTTLDLFKDPKGLSFTARRMLSLNETIFTLVQSSLCGIKMELHKEYLLAGRLVNESLLMLVTICDQFMEFEEKEPESRQCLVPFPEEHHHRRTEIFAQLLEWDRISDVLKQQLKNKSFEPCFRI